jgi:hypothetical protein
MRGIYLVTGMVDSTPAETLGRNSRRTEKQLSRTSAFPPLAVPHRKPQRMRSLTILTLAPGVSKDWNTKLGQARHENVIGASTATGNQSHSRKHQFLLFANCLCCQHRPINVDGDDLLPSPVVLV